MNQVSDLASRWHIGRIHPTPDLEPEGWTLEKLCDIAKLESGHTPSRNRPDYWDGGIPWLSLHDSKAIEGKVLRDTKMTVSALGLANSSARLLPEGTVALSRTATIGKVAVMGRQMATSQDFACYVCGPRLHNSYLAHLFRGMEAEWDRLMAGSTHNTIYMPTFENMQILVPPMEEQEAIAEALSDADALIEGLERLIAKKRLIKQGAMQDLLTAKRRLPGFSGEWEPRDIDGIAFILDNLRVPLNDAQRKAIPGSIPYCGANGVVDYVGQHLIDDDVILMAEDGGYFDEFQTRPIAYRMIGKIWVNNHAHVLKARTGFDHGFLFHSLRHKDITPFLASGTRAKLNKGELKKISIFAPKDEAEQAKIAALLDDMDAEIQALDTRLEKARQVKEGMMQNLLTGRIRLV